MHRITPVLLVAVLVVAAPASGAWVLPPRAPVTAQTLLDRYLPIARAAWPGSPCEGQERVTLNDDAEIRATIATDPGRFPAEAGGMAYGNGVADPLSPDYCRIGLSAWLTRTPASFCALLTHELGHLAGQGHSDIPGDVMSPRGPTYQPCESPPRRKLDELVRAVLPRPDAWRLSCAVVRGGDLRCRATAAFARHPRVVVVSADLKTAYSDERPELLPASLLARRRAATSASRSMCGCCRTRPAPNR